MFPSVGLDGSIMFIVGSILEFPGFWLVPEAEMLKRFVPAVCWNLNSGVRNQLHSPNPVVSDTLKLLEKVSFNIPLTLAPKVSHVPSLNLYWAVKPYPWVMDRFLDSDEY